jgi:hypothetical protein
MKGGGSNSNEDGVVVSGIGARLPGRENWFQDETERGSARWSPGFCGIKNDVGKFLMKYSRFWFVQVWVIDTPWAL